MTVAELIEKLEKVNPYLVVRVWDTQNQGFTDRFYVQPATYDDELLVTPSQGGGKKLAPSEWQSLFDQTAPESPRSES